MDVDLEKTMRGIVLAMFIFGLLSPTVAAAKKFTVNSLVDLPDLTPGDDKCVSYLVTLAPYVFIFCTLRAAIEEANSLPGRDEIIVGPGTYVLGVAGADEDGAATGDLDITESVSLTGKGRQVTVIDGGGLDRIFDIHGSDAIVEMSDLSLRNGKIITGSEEEGQGGGAIRNSASLTLERVDLMENVVLGNGLGSNGGALSNEGMCRLKDSSIFANESRSGGGLWNGREATMQVEQTTLRHNHGSVGGGVCNRGDLTLLNSTVSNNRKDSESSMALGIYNSGEMTMIHSTVAENNDGGEGAGLMNEGTLSLMNSVLASHDSSNCLLTIPLTSEGGNLDSDTSCALDQDSDFSGVDPLLTPLGTNGGFSRTHLFLLGSPSGMAALTSPGRELCLISVERGAPMAKVAT